MGNAIFVSYRREDASADARSIYQALRAAFGRHRLFIDVDTIERGRDFRQVLEQNLAACKVLVAVIGRRWLDARDDTGARRLDDPGDFVRMELARALAKDVVVIPVLVDGAVLPDPAELPPDIRDLAYRQAALVRHESFRQDMAALEQDIGRNLDDPVPRRRVALMAGAGLLIAGAAAAGLWWVAWGPPAGDDGPSAAGEATGPGQAGMDGVIAACVGRQTHPDAEEGVRYVAESMQRARFGYGWIDPAAGPGFVWKDITAVAADGDVLRIDYAWRNGKLLLTPVVEEEEEISRSYVFALTMKGAWSQTNGYGCLRMVFDDNGEADAEWSGLASTDYVGEARIRRQDEAR